jgi:glutamate-1-semialdehyde aminotransferase
LIFDEVITGFRVHPNGVQGLTGIQADLATYGKVVGGGLPIGVIAGKQEYMDALDGGFWQYGDHSVPEAGVTYFAGTFVRHPLSLAASKASLEYMKAKGPQLQLELTKKTGVLAMGLNAMCEGRGLPLHIVHFGSLWKIKFKEDVLLSELLFTLMRSKGIHIWDMFPCFMTEAFTEKDIQTVIGAFDESVSELTAAAIFAPPAGVVTVPKEEALPPYPGARLGKDASGKEAWFVQDPQRPGKYLQVNSFV